ncbi:MAG TPA: DUF2089 domain-containing protein [Ktedonobacterales bacterium]
MGQIWEAPQQCPVCGHDHMLIARLRCPACGSALEGEFAPRQSEGASAEGASRRSGPLPGTAFAATTRGEARFGRLARLSDEQLEFVEVFLRCRGVIKNVEDMLGVSYPTVRGRLNAVLDTLGLSSDDDTAPAEQRRIRREILADLSAGRISANEAHELLARMPQTMDDDR